MRQATTQGLYQYWNTVRSGRLAPRRYEIEPAQIVPFLSETIILEQPVSPDCRIRVAGTQVCEWLGDNLRGRLFYEQWNRADQRILTESLGTISQYGAVGLYTFEGDLVEDAPAAQFEMLLLPLTHLGERIERVLGSITVNKAPAWLSSSRPGKLRLTSNRTIWPDGRPKALISADRHFPAPLREVPALRAHDEVRRARLVRSNRRSFLVYDGGLSDSGEVDNK